MEGTHHRYQAETRATRGVSSLQKVRQVWTPEEDRILANDVARGMSERPGPPTLVLPAPLQLVQPLTSSETPHNKTISWHKVAACLPGRNNKDCRKRWHYSIAPTGMLRKGSWIEKEDEKLLAAVERHGLRWSKVAADVGSRNGDQCWKRWNDCLNPKIDKSPWTEDEVSKQTPLNTRQGPLAS